MIVARPTAAGRLIAAIVARGAPPLDELAHAAGTTAARLEQCRSGACALELEQQIRLAAVVAAIPELERPARALFAQAQAALRAASRTTEGHLTYPREHFR
jgi:hypothetical protein